MCICVYAYGCKFLSIYTARTIIYSNRKFTHFPGSELVFNKKAHTPEDNIINVPTIFTTKALLIFIANFRN